MGKIVKFPHTKSALIDTLARKAGRFEEDDPELVGTGLIGVSELPEMVFPYRHRSLTRKQLSLG